MEGVLRTIWITLFMISMIVLLLVVIFVVMNITYDSYQCYRAGYSFGHDTDTIVEPGYIACYQTTYSENHIGSTETVVIER